MNTTSERPPLPDHLSVDSAQPAPRRRRARARHRHPVNGNERKDVEEYCVSEGWVKVAVGKKVDRRGQPL